MKKMLTFATCMIGMLLMLPEHAQGQRKDKANVIPASAEDYKNLARTREITGIIASADAKSLTFRIDLPHLQPNAGRPYGKGQPGGGIRVVHDYKEYELDVSGAVVVKKMFVNADYDDKGNFKVNEAAAKELRTKGFIAAKIEDVKSGNIAKLVLSAPKQEDQAAGVGNVAKPVVKMIYLQKEGTPVEPSKAPEKKKKG